MELKLPKYKREFCCCECGHIWFAETTTVNTTICPNCNSTDRELGGVYACDSMAYAYAYDDIRMSLKERGLSFNYAKDHPYYYKK